MLVHLITKFDLMDEDHKAYVNFISSLKFPITKKTPIMIKILFAISISSFSAFDELLDRDLRKIEQGIIDFLIYVHHRRSTI